MSAALHPYDIAGLGYLDALDWDATPEDYRGPFKAAGGRGELPARARDVGASDEQASRSAELKVVF